MAEAERVLVPVDGSEPSEQAVTLAASLFPGVTLVLLQVINPAETGYSIDATIPTFPEGWYDDAVERAEQTLERLAATVDAETEQTTAVGKAASVTVEHAEQNNIDHIVMGSHGRQGVSRILLGSVAESVMRRAPVPVTVAR
ncbi:MAG: universal stress protein UspA related nucleotide-binding protein [halophilic archaeon J07HX5]|jgi:Universal stress protein UspA and related nucleotide-binding proteins|nr:MAG: universal stress protein UspA related nucleotide-binding protein [halophilic archaeon J07HX5]